jgi:hypothetical protein
MSMCKYCEVFYTMYPLQDDGMHHLETCNMEPIKCAFQNDIFNRNNWNCQLLIRLRDYAEGRELVQYIRDYRVAIIPTNTAVALVLKWYKSRGRTDVAFILDNDKEGFITLLEAKLIMKELKL